MGCNSSSFLEVIYFNRVKFTFSDESKENKYVYLCKKGETEEETKQQALAANKYFLEGITKIVKDFSDSIFKQVKSDTEKSPDEENDDSIMAATIKLEMLSGKLALELEEKFECLLIDSIDLE